MNWEEKIDNELIELLAEVEHDRWSRWHKYCMENFDDEHIKRWDRQAETKYKDLSEKEKESDRKEARLKIDVIKKVVSEILKQQEK